MSHFLTFVASERESKRSTACKYGDAIKKKIWSFVDNAKQKEKSIPDFS